MLIENSVLGNKLVSKRWSTEIGRRRTTPGRAVSLKLIWMSGVFHLGWIYVGSLALKLQSESVRHSRFW